MIETILLFENLEAKLQDLWVLHVDGILSTLKFPVSRMIQMKVQLYPVPFCFVLSLHMVAS